MNIGTSHLVDTLVKASERPTSRPGPGVVRLQSGEPDADTPKAVKDALAAALAEGLTHYASPRGDEQLLAALAARVSATSAVPRITDEIVITAGGTGGITCAILATVNEGDRVIIPDPTYSLYADAVLAAGGIPVFVPNTADLQLDVPALLEACRGARMLVICNPCNPTGAVYPQADLERIAAGLDGTDCLVLGDEAYSEIVYDEDFFSLLRIPTIASRLIYCQTFSKTYCMTGWRIGYVVAPSELAKGIARVHQMFTHSVNAAVQKAALAALQTPSSWISGRLEDYRERRDLVMSLLEGVPGIRLVRPQGAFYAFIGFSKDVSSGEMTQRLLKRGVAVRSGSEFGPSGQGYVRVSFSVDREALVKGLGILTTVLTE